MKKKDTRTNFTQKQLQPNCRTSEKNQATLLQMYVWEE